MTDIKSEIGQFQHQRDSSEPDSTANDSTGLGGYLTVLRLPGALRFSVAGAIGRTPMSMFGLGSLLLVASISGSYGAAGTVAAAGSVGYALAAPQVAKLADRFGQRRILRPTAVLFAIASGLFVVLAELRAPMWLTMTAGCVAGAATPSLGSMVRARWSALLDGGPQLLATAYALESVIDELIFVVGPAAVTLLATEVLPASGVLTAAVVGTTGTLLLAAQIDTEPAAHPAPRPVRAGRVRTGTGRTGTGRTGTGRTGTGRTGTGRTGTGRTGTGRTGTVRTGTVRTGTVRTGTVRTGTKRAGGRLPTRGLITLLPVFICLGAMFASIDVSTVAFAQQHGHKPLAGLILGCAAAGSAISGIWYGSRTWRAPVDRRFLIALCLVAVGASSFWALPGLGALAGVIFFSGMTMSPMLIGGFGLIERQAPPGRRTEGMTWLSSSISVGVACGSAIVGHIVDVGHARWGFVFAAGCGAVAALIGMAGARRLRGGYAGHQAHQAAQ